MHILTLMVPLVLICPTLAASNTVHLRAIHQNEEGSHLYSSHHSITKQLYGNTDGVSSLSRRGSPSRSRSRSSSPESLLSALFDTGTTRRVNTSDRRRNEPFAKARSNRHASVHSSHEVNDMPTQDAAEISKTWRSSVKLANPSMEAKGSATAVGKSVKFRSNTRAGIDRDKSKRRGGFAIDGPGRLQVLTEKPRGPDRKVEPSLMFKDLAKGQREHISIYGESKMAGKIDAEPSSSQTPRVDGELSGIGMMRMTAKQP